MLRQAVAFQGENGMGFVFSLFHGVETRDSIGGRKKDDMIEKDMDKQNGIKPCVITVFCGLSLPLPVWLIN